MNKPLFAPGGSPAVVSVASVRRRLRRRCPGRSGPLLLSKTWWSYSGQPR